MKLVFASILTSLLVIFNFPDPVNAKSSKEIFASRVTSVLKADRLRVMYKDRPLTINLFGIKCPELNEAFGEMAKRRTHELSYGKNVTIIKKRNGKAGFVIAEVFLSDGKNLSHVLLSEGLARLGGGWSLKDDEKYRLWQTVMGIAIQSKVGIWSEENKVNFEKSKKSDIKSAHQGQKEKKENSENEKNLVPKLNPEFLANDLNFLLFQLVSLKDSYSSKDANSMFQIQYEQWLIEDSMVVQALSQPNIPDIYKNVYKIISDLKDEYLANGWQETNTTSFYKEELKETFYLLERKGAK